MFPGGPLGPADALDHFEAVAARHAQVQKQKIEVACRDESQSVIAVRCDVARVPSLVEQLPQEFGGECVVLGQQDLEGEHGAKIAARCLVDEGDTIRDGAARGYDRVRRLRAGYSMRVR